MIVHHQDTGFILRRNNSRQSGFIDGRRKDRHRFRFLIFRFGFLLLGFQVWQADNKFGKPAFFTFHLYRAMQGLYNTMADKQSQSVPRRCLRIIVSLQVAQYTVTVKNSLQVCFGYSFARIIDTDYQGLIFRSSRNTYFSGFIRVFKSVGNQIDQYLL